MSLIQSQQDDIEVLRAEDEAIIAALQPKETPPIPLGQDLADLIESLSHDDQTPVHEG